MATGIPNTTIKNRIINFIWGCYVVSLYNVYNSKIAVWFRKFSFSVTLNKLKNKVIYNYYRLLNKLYK